MSKLLFVNGNLHGHINPTLPIVKELVRRGEEVYYFSTKEFQSKIVATGAIFMDYGEEFNQFIKDFQPHGSHPFYTLMEYMLALNRAVSPIVLRQTEGMIFDALLHDVMFGGGNILAKMMNIPSIASCSSFVMEKPPLPARMLEPGFHPQLDYLYGTLNKVRTEWHTPDLQLSDIFFQHADRTLVYTSRRFHPLGESYNSSFLFVGPSIMDREEKLDFPINTSEGMKLIYISLGTISNNCIDFYNKCLETFAGRNYQVVISLGNKTNVAALNSIPENFVIKNYIPQLELLKLADVFISHGGLNSVSEALYYGVPTLAIPQANDQPAVARRLTELGAGLELNMTELTSGLLLQTVEELLFNPDYKKQCIALGETFRQAGGYERATIEIIQYLKAFDLNSL